jgi:hypothetical protein
MSLSELKDIELSEAEKYLLSLYSFHANTLDRPRPESTRSTDSQGTNTLLSLPYQNQHICFSVRVGSNAILV